MTYAGVSIPGDGGLFLYHCCSGLSCTTKSQPPSFLSRILKLRIFNVEAAEKLSLGRAMVTEYKNALDGAPMDAGGGVGAFVGDSSSAGEAAVAQAMGVQPAATGARATPKGVAASADSLHSHDA